jgi:hypothetical protein
MAMKEIAMQRIREAPSAPGRDTFIPPTFLPICCACGLIRDDTRFSPGRELWITQQTYRTVNPSDLALSHTYSARRVCGGSTGDRPFNWSVSIVRSPPLPMTTVEGGLPLRV